MASFLRITSTTTRWAGGAYENSPNPDVLPLPSWKRPDTSGAVRSAYCKGRIKSINRGLSNLIFPLNASNGGNEYY